jgi:hypothetical protein
LPEIGVTFLPLHFKALIRLLREPRGQIQPQKNLPKINVRRIRLRAQNIALGMSDGIPKWEKNREINIRGSKSRNIFTGYEISSYPEYSVLIKRTKKIRKNPIWLTLLRFRIGLLMPSLLLETDFSSPNSITKRLEKPEFLCLFRVLWV